MSDATAGRHPLAGEAVWWAGVAAALLVACPLAGCGDKRITLVDRLRTVNRVAIIDLSENTDPAAGEFFTNEFISLGYEVVERSNLDRIIKEGFAKNEYLDPETLAEWGRGKAVQAVVLFKLVSVEQPAADEERSSRQLSGWVRAVDVETSMILLTYNATLEVPVSSGKGPRAFEAYQRYAEMVCDDIAAAMKRRGIRPAERGAPAPPVITTPQES
jgi:hypothetical protein